MLTVSILKRTRNFSSLFINYIHPKRSIFFNQKYFQQEKPSNFDYALYRKQTLKNLNNNNPYPNDKEIMPNISIRELFQTYSDKLKQPGDSCTDQVHIISGRVSSIRSAGKKMHFIDIFGELSNDKIQIKISQNLYKGSLMEDINLIKRGDIISIEGFPTRTKAGEFSLSAYKINLLTPCLKTMPRKNVKLKYRKRYMDFLANPEMKDVFYVRSKIIKEIRAFLDEDNFLEVETPIMWPSFGGAIAKPFETFHNDLELAMFLRIAPELHLKQLLIGGFEKVYEIGKQFRNEGRSFKHNPEFTTLEFYKAYSNCNDMMEMASSMLQRIVCKIFGEEMKVQFQEFILDFKSDFKKLDYLESIEVKIGKELPDIKDIHLNSKEAFAFMEKIALDEKIDIKEVKNCAKLLDKIFSHFVEPNLIQPTFVTNIPQCLSPLARPHSSKPYISERFELYVAGNEIINAYSELNSPEIQKEMFVKQLCEQDRSEVSDVDDNYLKALEYGLPPTGGFGMGIDRLTMILTNQSHIKNVIFFPILRPVDSSLNSEQDEYDDVEDN